MVGRFSDPSKIVDEALVERRTHFVVGASMLVSKEFVEEVGPMDAKYFLYHEEIDWSIRAKGKWKILYCHGAVVFHKHGAALKTGITLSDTNPSASYYSVRSKMRLTYKYFPYWMPTVFAVSLLRAARAYLLGYPKVAAAIISGLGLTTGKAQRQWAIVQRDPQSGSSGSQS